MLHQYLFERGEDTAHLGEPWRREIMRLTKLISGKTIWAGPSRVVRQNGKAVRINAHHPETKEPSLPQAVIARWPHDGAKHRPRLSWSIIRLCRLKACPIR